MKKRIGAKSIKDIPPEILVQINNGEIETVTLVETLAADFTILMKKLFPTMDDAPLNELDKENSKSILARMKRGGEILADKNIDDDRFFNHTSDIVRGWCTYAIAHKHHDIESVLKAIKPLALDDHSGVREWAWLALRGHVIQEPEKALQLLSPWTLESNPYARRFAVEILRPRGVWCAHIPFFRNDPNKAKSLLEPLMNEDHKYVQDSVANWLNDASKDHPEWVHNFCKPHAESASKNTKRIVKRALRTLHKKPKT